MVQQNKISKNEDFPLIPAMVLASHQGNDAKTQHILWGKAYDMIRRKCKDYERNSLPSIEEILNCKLKNPPVEVLSALLGMCKKSCDLFHLVEKYPTAFHAETEDGDLPIHLLCTKDRKYEWIDKMVFQRMKQEEKGGKLGGFGGLLVKNRRGLSPLDLLNASIYRARSSSEIDQIRRLITLIQSTAFKHLQMKNNGEIIDDGTLIREPSQIPILHAALIMGCPPHIISLAKSHCQIDGNNESVYSTKFLGQVPVQIAAVSPCISSEVFLSLFRENPKVANELDEGGDFLLHRVIKERNAADNKDTEGNVDEDVFFIGSIVQEAPDALIVQDAEHFLYPFALAACEGWPLGIVYGLLRTNPFVLEKM